MQNPEYLRAMEAARIAREKGELADEATILRYAASIAPQEELVAGNTTKEVSVPTYGPGGMVSQATVVVPKTPEEMAGATARNLQLKMGLKDPVSDAGIDLGTRVVSGFAPTKEDKEAYYNLRFGENKWINLGGDRYLVNITDKNGNSKWTVDNPAGLDVGDVAALASNVPQLISATTAALELTPTPAGRLAQLAKVSGLSAAASQLTGAVQDVLFRFGTGQEIRPSEIAERRIPQAAAEFAGGVLIPAVGGKVLTNMAERSAINRYYKGIEKAGTEAEERLRAAGITPATSTEIGQAILEANPVRRSASSVGDKIAEFVTQQDKAIRQKTEDAFQTMTGQNSAEFSNILNKVAAPSDLTALETGKIVQTAAMDIYGTATKATRDLYDAGYAAVEDALAKSGQTGYRKTNFVDLSNTRNFLKSFNREYSLTRVTPETKTVVPGKRVGFSAEPDSTVVTPESVDPISVRSAVNSIIGPLEQAQDSLQRLSAVRYQRSRLGEFLNGRTDLFEGLDTGTAKKLYGALTEDITGSLNKLSVPGADLLRKADNEYRRLAELTQNNPLIDSLVNGKFQSGEQVIRAISNASATDWKILEGVIGSTAPTVFSQAKRSVIDAIKKDATETVFGQPVVNIERFASRLRGMDTDIRNQIFGKPNVDVIEGLATRYEGLRRSYDIFSTPNLPTQAQLNNLQQIGTNYGLDKAFKAWRDFTNLAQQRRDSLAESIISLANYGNDGVVQADTNQVLDAIVFNPNVKTKQLGTFLSKMPRSFKQNLGDATFNQVFERSRSAVQGQIRAGVIDGAKLEANIFGNKERQAVLESLIGDRRMQLLRDWVAVERKFGIAASRKTKAAKEAARLAALTPYPNLQAAQATSMALESVAGNRFLKSANPEQIYAFPQARRILLFPTKSNADIAILQQAINLGGKQLFDDYNEMMNDLTPEQQVAVNQYLFGGRD